VAEEPQVIIVDSSVWIAYFSKKKSAASEFLEQALKDGTEIAILSIILTEVLMGFREEPHFHAAQNILIRVPQIPLTTGVYIRAAILFRNLLRRGKSVRGAIDCVIAQTCIETEAELFTLDRDFHNIAQYSPLKLLHLKQ